MTTENGVCERMLTADVSEASPWGRGIGQSGAKAKDAKDEMWRKLSRERGGSRTATATGRAGMKTVEKKTKWIVGASGDILADDSRCVNVIRVRRRLTGEERTKKIAERKVIAILFERCMAVKEFFAVVAPYYYRTPSALAMDYDWVGRERWVSLLSEPHRPERIAITRDAESRALAWSWTSEVRRGIETLNACWRELEEDAHVSASGKRLTKNLIFVRPYVGTGTRRRLKTMREMEKDYRRVKECMMGWDERSRWNVRGGHYGTKSGSGGERAFGRLGGACGTGGTTVRESLKKYNAVASATLLDACLPNCECCWREDGGWKTGMWATWIETPNPYVLGGMKKEDYVRTHDVETVMRTIFAAWKSQFARAWGSEWRERMEGEWMTTEWRESFGV